MEKLNVIAILGHAGAGKDTAGKMLCEMGDGVTIAFADKLKQICGDLFGLTQEQMYDPAGKEAPTKYACLICPECKKPEVEEFTQERTKLARCLNNGCGVTGAIEVFKGFWTGRTILQFTGTEWGRRINPSVWTTYALNMAAKNLENTKTQFVAITDCRFPNEAEAVWAVGGEVWRIRRPDGEGAASGLKGHASETAQDAIPDSRCNAVILNDSTLDVLRGRLASEFQRFKKERKDG